MDFVIIYCTVSSKSEGKKIAKVLMKYNLAACINIFDKVESIFSWDGKLMHEKEALMMIKTRKELFPKINRAIHELHSYNVPEVVAIPIAEADETYLKWIAHETRNA